MQRWLPIGKAVGVCAVRVMAYRQYGEGYAHVRAWCDGGSWMSNVLMVHGDVALAMQPMAYLGVVAQASGGYR